MNYKVLSGTPKFLSMDLVRLSFINPYRPFAHASKNMSRGKRRRKLEITGEAASQPDETDEQSCFKIRR